LGKYEVVVQKRPILWIPHI